MQEIWKDIKEYEGSYQISSFGKVKSLPKETKNQYSYKERILSPDIRGKYLSVVLCKNRENKHFVIHRLVAEAFIPNFENKPQVNHIDGNKLNNTLNNLEWCTCSENFKHAYKLGLKTKTGEKNSMNKLTEWDVKIIRKLYKNTKYWNQPKLAKLFNLTRSGIGHIVTKKTWAHI